MKYFKLPLRISDCHLFAYFGFYQKFARYYGKYPRLLKCL